MWKEPRLQRDVPHVRRGPRAHLCGNSTPSSRCGHGNTTSRRWRARNSISTQALTPVWERSYEGLAVFSFLCGSCIGSLLSLSATLVVDVAEVRGDPDALARASGLICAFLGIGGTLGPVIAGAFYDAYETYLPGFIFGACALALAAISVHVEATDKSPDVVVSNTVV